MRAWSDIAPSVTGSPLPFCERCGAKIGSGSAVTRFGLRACEACGIYACAKCWSVAAGACPGCGRRAPEPWGPSKPARPGLSMDLPQPSRGRLAFSGLVVSVSALLLVGLTSMQPAGSVESALATPGAAEAMIDPVASQAPGPLDAATPNGSASPPPTTERPTATIERSEPDAPVRTAGEPGRSSSGPAVPSPTEGSDPTPRRTASPTPRQGTPVPPTPPPTIAPTPSVPVDPTPPPTPVATPAPPPPTSPPTPDPTPECVEVPNLVGITVGEARQAWLDAGFTGSFSPASGLVNKVVETQSQTAGSCLSASSSIAVTYS